MITSSDKPIENSNITIKYEPTGTTNNTQTDNRGSFSFVNLKPGGPYTIKVTYVGYNDEIYKDIYLSLGSNPDIKISLTTKSDVLKDVVVSSKTQNNKGTVVGSKQLTTLPSIGRSLSDFTRLTPQSNNNSFGGSNFRYNNLTIDGSSNNDAIGFSNSFGGVSGGGQSGAAGAGTRTVPYSIDVIQEVQVQLAPYDVKLGNFTGGSVNAVTKSGTNDFHGTLYAYTKSLFNTPLFGKSIDGKNTSMPSSFYEHQYGFTFGGPIVKNKSFFIFNFEQTRRQEPTFYNAGDIGSPISTDEAIKIKNAFSNHGFDAGGFNQTSVFTNSDKFFGRFDFNLNPKNTLMFRVLYTKGWGNNIERSTGNFQFGSTDFTQHTNNINLVTELKTKVNKDINNQLLVGYINVHEYRDFPGNVSPFIDIAGSIWLGTWREASIYNMKQQTLELTDNLTIKKGINKFTIGTHNEFYNLSYGFVNSWNGRWQYNSISDFINDKPARVRGSFSTNSLNNNRDYLYNNDINPYNVSLLSVYGQDEISVNKRLKITTGLRLDYSFVGNNPYTDDSLKNPNNDKFTSKTYDFVSMNNLNNQWLGKLNLSPRFGFHWDIKGDGNVIIRGGSGIFIGRMPFAWMGNAYNLSGNHFGNIDYQRSSNDIPFSLVSGDILKNTVPSSNSNTREINIIDNDFKLPRILRSNIATDIKFGRGYKLTLDFLYTKTLYDVKFQQINLIDSVIYPEIGPKLSPIYQSVNNQGYTTQRRNTNFSNVYLLKNTSEGYRYNITFQLSKSTSNIKVGKKQMDMNWMIAYTYGISKDISNGIRNSFSSNYEVNPSIIPNSPQLDYSNFDLRHRIVGTLGFSFKWNKENTTMMNFFYSSQSGNPYSLVYSNPGFFKAGSNAALVYIPEVTNDPDLNNFINNDSYLRTRRGKYAERNALRTPWNHNLDVRLMHEFKLKDGKGVQISFDVMNLLNLINNDWGKIYFVTNTNNYTVPFMKINSDGSNSFIKPNYNNQYYTVDPINSRWQGQIGVKLLF